MEALSRKLFCRVEAVRIANVEFCFCRLTYLECKAHTLYYIFVCGLSVCTIFFYIIHKCQYFLKKNNKLLDIKRVS